MYEELIWNLECFNHTTKRWMHAAQAFDKTFEDMFSNDLLRSVARPTPRSPPNSSASRAGATR